MAIAAARHHRPGRRPADHDDDDHHHHRRRRVDWSPPTATRRPIRGHRPRRHRPGGRARGIEVGGRPTAPIDDGDGRDRHRRRRRRRADEQVTGTLPPPYPSTTTPTPATHRRPTPGVARHRDRARRRPRRTAAPRRRPDARAIPSTTSSTDDRAARRLSPLSCRGWRWRRRRRACAGRWRRGGSRSSCPSTVITPRPSASAAENASITRREYSTSSADRRPRRVGRLDLAGVDQRLAVEAHLDALAALGGEALGVARRRCRRRRG